MSAELKMKKKRLTDFIRTEYGQLVRFVRRSIDDTADREAEDIVQDVITNLFDKADFTLPVENLAAYVYRSIKNRVIDLFRNKKNRPLSLDAAATVPGNDSCYTLADLLHDPRFDVVKVEEQNEWVRQLYSAISRLNELEQAVVIATEIDRLPFAHLAARWNVPIGTLLARKARALKKIKRDLVDIYNLPGSVDNKKKNHSSKEE